ncbi:MAG: hypothetical protein ACOY46_10870 [Bacillota bacterium]
MLNYPFENNINMLLLFFLAGLAAGWIIKDGVMDIIAGAGFQKQNYQGEKIPVGAGVLVLLGSIPVLTFSIFIFPVELKQKATAFMFALSIYTCMGLMDDYWGSPVFRGIKGHLKSLLSGKPTTGSVKAIAGGLAALFVAIISFNPGESLFLIVINTIIIALSVNSINLLDLRPGRAGKAFLFWVFLIAAFFYNKYETIFAVVAAGVFLAYFPLDLKARAMMGDAGSNALGAVLGITSVWVLDLNYKLVLLTILLILHLIAEKDSITRLIESNRLLSYLDRLGQNKIS